MISEYLLRKWHEKAEKITFMHRKIGKNKECTYISNNNKKTLYERKMEYK